MGDIKRLRVWEFYLVRHGTRVLDLDATANTAHLSYAGGRIKAGLCESTVSSWREGKIPTAALLILAYRWTKVAFHVTYIFVYSLFPSLYICGHTRFLDGVYKGFIWAQKFFILGITFNFRSIAPGNILVQNMIFLVEFYYRLPAIYICKN